MTTDNSWTEDEVSAFIADIDAFRADLGDKQRAAFDGLLVRAAEDADVEGFLFGAPTGTGLTDASVGLGRTVVGGLKNIGIPNVFGSPKGSGGAGPTGAPSGGAGPAPT